jgi:hypothetical protein
MLRRIDYKLPDASAVRLRSSTVTQDIDGAVIVGGSAATRDTGFIARLNPGSEDLILIQTSP